MATDTQRRPLLTVAEAVERLRVSEHTVRRLIARGEIPAVKVGALLRIDPDELEDWIFGSRSTT